MLQALQSASTTEKLVETYLFQKVAQEKGGGDGQVIGCRNSEGAKVQEGGRGEETPARATGKGGAIDEWGE